MQYAFLVKNGLQEAHLIASRTLTAAALVILGVLLLLLRLSYLQLWKHDFYTLLSEKNRINLRPLAPKRGLIFDRNGVLLAENQAVFHLILIPTHTPDVSDSLERLSKIISLSAEEETAFQHQLHLHRRFQPVLIKQRLTPQEVARFYVHQYAFPGIEVEAGLVRHYPLGATTASPLGYVGRLNAQDLKKFDPGSYAADAYVGKTGIERYYETLLHGKTGYQQIEVDASGHALGVLQETAPVAGHNLYLTIDSRLQRIAQKAMRGMRGAVVAIDPYTGEILALLSEPTFDPNLFTQGITAANFRALQQQPGHPLFNRAVRGQFPLASTIKPFLALQALDQGLITPETVIYDPGFFQLPHTQHRYRDWKYDGHGSVNVSKALIVSCDTFFYHLSLQLGMHGIVDILTRFGFGHTTGIDLDNEVPGLIPTPHWKLHHKYMHWYTGDTVLSGIGQGYLLTTPLQLASAVGILGTQGYRVQPRLLRQYQPPGALPHYVEPRIQAPVVLHSSHWWSYIARALQGVIDSRAPQGTGFRFGNDHRYTIAAKTGTAQLYSKDTYSDTHKKQYIKDDSLFIAFAPVEKPKIALAVVIEHAADAPRVARKIIDAYLNE